ncbi:hypothetical protein [Streptomyces sp. NBC_00057]|uniref:hypothetical protein n=1 Tax=Streptomyces sp. NBC_00057 TaxID=2975634 RepID=UPI003246978C
MGEWAGETVGPDVWETCRELTPSGSVFAFLAEHRGGGPDFWFGNLRQWADAPPGSALLAVSPHSPGTGARPRSLQGGRPRLPSRGRVPATDYTGWLAAPRASTFSSAPAPNACAPTTALWRATAPNFSPASRV